ncbi:uncharacterized protein LOC129409799 isoform X3 [Boleophthalmus pectinirostris]|uniref:uncharacterized protein LOC129409799 isoform X3 n=1 Tax=Boleophthalmus pectinirostris TaxID=150288 RepID=UPI00242C7D99|nr:uncharacterized protein LOC129409799 isoform X3 [Boleophthalmus pectinirostris]
MSVNITDVHRSDAGLYQCGLDYGQKNSTMVQFQIEVSPVETPTPGLTLGAAPTTSLHNVTPAQTTQRTQEASEVTSSQQPQEEHNSSTLSVVLQYVAVSVTTILIIVSGSILIWCWKRKTNRPTAAADDCETPEYENYRVAAVKESADCIYQNLPVDNMDPNQTYSNI